MRILLIISFLCSVHFSHAQDRDLVREMTDNDFQIRQIPGSEQRLKELLQEVDTESDTIYAAMYSPTICPLFLLYLSAVALSLYTVMRRVVFQFQHARFTGHLYSQIEKKHG